MGGGGAGRRRRPPRFCFVSASVSLRFPRLVNDALTKADCFLLIGPFPSQPISDEPLRGVDRKQTAPACRVSPMQMDVGNYANERVGWGWGGRLPIGRDRKMAGKEKQATSAAAVDGEREREILVVVEDCESSRFAIGDREMKSSPSFALDNQKKTNKQKSSGIRSNNVEPVSIKTRSATAPHRQSVSSVRWLSH